MFPELDYDNETAQKKNLEINYATSAAGEIRVEIQDENGKAIPGFTMEGTQAIIGNELKRVVSWKENDPANVLASRPIPMSSRPVYYRPMIPMP